MSAEFGFSPQFESSGEKEAFVDILDQAGLSYDSFCEILNRPVVDGGIISEWVKWLNEAIIDDRQQELDFRANNHPSGRLHLSPEDRVLDVFAKLIGWRVTLWLVEGGIEYVHQLVSLTMSVVNATEELSYLDRGDWYRVQGFLIKGGALDDDVIWPIGRK